MRLLLLQLAAASASAALVPTEPRQQVHIEELPEHVKQAFQRVRCSSERGAEDIRREMQGILDGYKDQSEDVVKDVIKDIKNDYRGLSTATYDKTKDLSTYIQRKYKKNSSKTKKLADEVLAEAEKKWEQHSEDVKNVAEVFSDKIERTYKETSGAVEDVFDEAMSFGQNATADTKSLFEQAYSKPQAWYQSARNRLDDLNMESIVGDSYSSKGHHKHTPNRTVYELIASSRYAKILTKSINQFPDLVNLLNSTAANYTVFAPIDSAFEKVPHGHLPSKGFLKALLTYHISPEYYPASRIFLERTIPSLLKSEYLGKHALPQRLVTNIGLRGLTVNILSRVVKPNVYGTNGVVHAIDNIIIPPPTAMTIVDLDPGDLSTLQLGLLKTDLFDTLNDTSEARGGTLMAPTNTAFSRLGHATNAFLFSKYGLKYLKALLKYHVIPDNVLYSDAFYKASSFSSQGVDEIDGADHRIPKGLYHVDLPTLLKDRSLSIDIARWGRFIEIKINAFARVGFPDVVALDGNIHLLDEVLIPPKKLDGGQAEEWTGGEIEVDELKERLEDYIDNDNDGNENEELFGDDEL